MGSKKEGKHNEHVDVIDIYVSWLGGGTFFVNLFADVGPSVPCGAAAVRQHKQWD